MLGRIFRMSAFDLKADTVAAGSHKISFIGVKLLSLPLIARDPNLNRRNSVAADSYVWQYPTK